jgi:hypothetical protein
MSLSNARVTFRFRDFELDLAAYGCGATGTAFDSRDNQWSSSCCC